MRKTVLLLLLLRLLVPVTGASCDDDTGGLEDGKQPVDGKSLRLMTYNIHHGEGVDGVFDLERLAEVINTRRPDLVAVQEVDVKTGRSGGVDQAAELARLTGMHYFFGKFMDYDGGEYGQMVLSKFPIVRARNLQLPAGPEPRTAVAVEVDIELAGAAGSQRLLFVGNHFYATEEQRSAQASRLVEYLAEEIEGGVPIVLAGDFNSTPGSKPMAILNKHWVAPTLGGHRHTWPSAEPRVEIDHILYAPAGRFKFVKSKVVVEKVASDHRPVLTVVELLGRG